METGGLIGSLASSLCLWLRELRVGAEVGRLLGLGSQARIAVVVGKGEAERETKLVVLKP